MSWINAIIQGILLGGLYALFACGLSLMFGVMRIINLAHGDLAVIGAFGVWMVATQARLSPFIALLPVLPVMLVLGYFLHRTVLARSLRSGPLTPLLTTFGLSIVIQNALLQIFSPDVHSLGSLTGSISTGSWRLTSQLSLPYLGVLTLAVAILLLGALQFILQRTGLGREMRATAQDPETAALVGYQLRRFTPEPPRSRSRPPRSLALSWRFTRPSTPPAGPPSSSLRSRRSSLAVSVHCGAPCSAGSCSG
jgi:branched-chain amino acid transport system permease protein